MISTRSQRAFWIAVQFLTRLPTPELQQAPTPAELSRAALYYPVVGLLIGTILIILASLFSGYEPMLIAALLLTVWVLLTGGLHLDGLADSADAWLGGIASRERTHEILKDPLVGTAGVVAVALLFIIKYSALFAILKHGSNVFILLAPVLGRGFILLLFTSTDYVRKQGLATDVVNGLNGQAALMGLLPVVLISALYSPLAVLAILLCFVALRRMMIQRLGGCTGDTAGALVEITEAVWLFSAALFV